MRAMPHTIIIGDGPGGLSAALFLAKRGHDVVVFGQDKTAMHAALLFNYLGIEEISGSDFQKVARKQVEARGAKLRDERVTEIAQKGGELEVRTEGGETLTAKHLILSEGKGAPLAKKLGLEPEAGGGIATDKNGLSRVANVYVIGRSARPGRSQAINSAGDGAAAALDILSREQGEDVADWDTPPES
jgi:thioredoxin reductase (NADPH)